MRRLPRWIVIAPLLALAACGGRGGGTQGAAAPISPQNTPPAGSPAQAQVPAATGGGIWHGTTAATQETLTLLVAEDGTLRMVSGLGPRAAAGPAFGAGAMIVTGGDQVSGAYGAKRLLTASLIGGAESCDFTGTLHDRVSMTIELACTDDSGVERSDSVTLVYNSDYETDSSLAAIAGNYTLPFRERTNVLTIAGDGVVFGLYDNGPACTVNGLVTVVDPAFNLYRVEWQLSGCKAPFARYDGALLTGLAALAPRGVSSGAFIIVLTGLVDAHLEGLSILYERT